MSRISAGILLFRRHEEQAEVLLVHPGGPFWKNKDDGAWSIPKGEVEPGEDLLAAARRETGEELGPGVRMVGEPRQLAPVRQKSGKLVHAFLVEGDFDPAALASNTFTLEWPPKSGKHVEFPEVDRADWFRLSEARRKINPAQAAFLDALLREPQT